MDPKDTADRASRGTGEREADYRALYESERDDHNTCHALLAAAEGKVEVAVRALEEIRDLETSDSLTWMQAALRSRDIASRALAALRAAKGTP
jgi:hypothetical protein